MKQDPASHILELQSKIHILERENESLSAKAEENLLLNRAFEEINTFDAAHLLTNTLESISILLDIQFAGIFQIGASGLVCVNSYAQFMNEDSVAIHLAVSDKWICRLHRQQTCCEDSPAEATLSYPHSPFVAHKIAVIPFASEIMKNRCFVFANDNVNSDLSHRILLFEKLIRIISVKLDRYYYQQELKALNADLEQKVAARTADLVAQNHEYAALNEEYKMINEELFAAKEHAEESDRLKTAFLQNMSHEIRTPMNAIMGFSSLLVENYNDKAKLETFSEIISSRCNDLLDIINDILDISKIESGQIDITNKIIDLRDIFADLTIFFREYQKRIGKPDIAFELKCSCEATSCIVRTDGGKLKQILINLISNAYKFTDKGSITFGCEYSSGRDIVFYVADTGAGIPADKHEAIFERFFQLQQDPSKLVSGTGLGLSIVKGLVKVMGGTLWLQSEVGKGSRFSFSLPIAASAPPDPVQIASYENSEKLYSSKTILIVEDDYYNSIYLKELLANTGVRIQSTEYGTEAVRIAGEHDIDLILMDIRLPDISGYDATKMIRHNNKIIKIIAQTAYAAQDEYRKAMDAGCDDYISKPMKKETLYGLLKKHLR